VTADAAAVAALAFKNERLLIWTSSIIGSLNPELDFGFVFLLEDV